ncbi:MAG TPA: hypothetical protein VKM93_17880 [Terriglobia bacterium]|nr:hypothetical protein [Terriglobia bacterium]
MSSPPERTQVRPPLAAGSRLGRRAWAGEALVASFYDAVGLLFTPFDGGRWFKLSLVCLFLGGGTPTAAFNWTFALPGEVSVRPGIERARAYIGNHQWLVVLAILLGLAITVGGLYVRSVFRFILVDTIVTHEISVRAAWTELRPLGRSYFRWLLGLVLSAAAALSVTAIAAFEYLRLAAATGTSSLAFSAVLVGILLSIALVGLGLMVIVTLTDDLVVPLMYAERIPLGAAWRKLARCLRFEAGAVTLYVLLRFVVSLGVAVLVLLLLFPVLFSVFSGVILAVGLVVLALKMVGLAWVWNGATILVASAAAMLLTAFLVVLLSAAGMPGQVLLQGFGMRFASPRFPAVESLWLSSRRAGVRA